MAGSGRKRKKGTIAACLRCSGMIYYRSGLDVRKKGNGQDPPYAA